MKILALVPAIYNTSPGQRFRLEQWEPWLRKAGVRITWAAFEDNELHATIYQSSQTLTKLRLVTRALKRRVDVLRCVREYDAVYVFREAALLGPPLFERWVKSAGIPLVFDFDDAIFVPYKSPTNGYLSLLKFGSSKTRTICRIADHVMGGSPHLADYARQFNSNVSIIPTTIDTNKYSAADSWEGGSTPVIGWSGSHSTVAHLNTLREALKRLAKKERFKLRVIGTPKYELDGVEVEAMPWRADSEVTDLRAINIGIMPLPDDRWSRGKCGLKALQYMALGIPTVCSPVGVNAEIINDQENGMLAVTEDEWIIKLSQLLHSADLREKLGRAGRETVETQYSASSQASRVFKIFEALTMARRLSGVKQPVPSNL